MGVRVRNAVTPPGWWGVYDHRRRLITLRPGLGPIQLDCTLMHELGHAHYGHVGVTGKQELLADRWAAHRLISFDDLLAAAGMEQSSSSVASSLGVLPGVLETYLKMLTRADLDALRTAAIRRAA
ncbi:ImmA/IrrE family metallo-endopeptidase [Arthrobacter sp. PsM3]|uniref:ImmA/IrrE family metallo-endopeptidase n=1 Tax=Arthrobacter sp. PsM3 TaxID=3030531 RepID=UPI00263AF6FB|nr:ImmA/IrrE family metallo-endopeptidase [Arthrobacter sp. PsM3]MDN4644979.1 ImmA/IrrE family metallo-endopeptidase [Arthrobacter sp. PsM3]